MKEGHVIFCDYGGFVYESRFSYGTEKAVKFALEENFDYGFRITKIKNNKVTNKI